MNKIRTTGVKFVRGLSTYCRHCANEIRRDGYHGVIKVKHFKGEMFECVLCHTTFVGTTKKGRKENAR